jgi:uncharacterized protein
MSAQPYILNLEHLGIDVNKDIDKTDILSLFRVHKAGSTHGVGLFAARDIRKNEEILKITGPIVPEKIADTLYSSYGIDVLVQIGPKKWILPNNEARFINHACNPNMGFKSAGTFVAMKNIKKEEELTFDYSMSEIDDSDYIWSIDCLCGDPNCRKVISSLDIFNKKLELAEKYKGYLPAFVLKEIKRRSSK